ncbi:MAG: YgjV family protein [Clostridia bacterium]|nr:YgjV family protein [Clostridia bacterium]
MDILAQVIGILGMLAAVVSYQCKTNRNYFIWQGLSGLCFSIQFVMIGAWAGLAFNLYNIVRAVVNQTKFSRSVVTLIALEALVVFAASLSIFAFMEAWWLVLLAFIAQATGTFAMWTKKGRVIRISQLAVVSPFWLLYDLLIPTPSIGGILCELFNMVSVIVSFIRFRKSGFDNT